MLAQELAIAALVVQAQAPVHLPAQAHDFKLLIHQRPRRAAAEVAGRQVNGKALAAGQVEHGILRVQVNL